MTVAEAIADYVGKNVKVFKTDRTQTVGASEIGQCARKVFALKFEGESGTGVPRDEDFVDTWGARERGNLIERYLVVPAIRERYGERAWWLGEDQQTFVDGFISCTPDCYINEDSAWLIEIKSIDPRINLLEPKPEHTYQAQVQLGLLNTILPEGRGPKYAVISYTDASFLSETKEFRVDYDPAVYKVARARAAQIMTASSFHELLPEGYIAGGKECEHCPFARACGVSRRRVPEDSLVAQADPQFVAEISDRARQLKFVEAELEVMEKQKRELQYEIKERLREKSLRRIVGDGVSISWIPVKGRAYVDLEALRATLPADVVEQFIRQAEAGDRLTVTLKTTREKAA